jgi:hypothetical protein
VPTGQIDFEDVPTATVFDVFAETASQLIGRYVGRSQRAETQEERAGMWSKAMAVRDAKHGVPARDRDQLIEYIEVWRHDIAQLDEGDHGSAG